MLRCSETDRRFIRTMRDEGVFEDLRSDLIPAAEGTEIIACADGDQEEDLKRQHRDICPGKKRHHTLMLNGGALLLPDDSTIADKDTHEGETLLRHALKGCTMKGLGTLILYIHLPCGAATEAGMSAQECVEQGFKAKDKARTYFAEHGKPDVFVMLYCHVDHGDRKRTYRVNRAAYAELEERGALTKAA